MKQIVRGENTGTKIGCEGFSVRISVSFPCSCVCPFVSVTVSGISPKDEQEWENILWVGWLWVNK